MTTSHEEIKTTVRDTYARIATSGASSCCGKTSCCGTGGVTFSEDYSVLEGYVPEADLGLGCGIPTDIARIAAGETVLDLGSGAGNDVFVARRLTGETGRVIGIDMTPEMIRRAEANNKKLGYTNVEFRFGDIEAMPVGSESVDVVISNCVLNLVPDKARAFAELFRVLKPGGRFAVSDIVLNGELPEPIRKAAEMYAGCVAGAMQKDEYLAAIRNAGFTAVSVARERPSPMSDETLLEYVSAEGVAAYKASGSTVTSITVYGEKPAAPCCGEKTPCC